MNMILTDPGDRIDGEFRSAPAGTLNPPWPRLPRAAYSSSYLGFVIDFVRASWRGDLSALGVVRPRSLGSSTLPDAAIHFGASS